MTLTKDELGYYRDKMNDQEISDWTVMTREHAKGKIRDGLWKGIHDSFWDCVKERVDREE